MHKRNLQRSKLADVTPANNAEQHFASLPAGANAAEAENDAENAELTNAISRIKNLQEEIASFTASSSKPVPRTHETDKKEIMIQDLCNRPIAERSSGEDREKEQCKRKLRS